MASQHSRPCERFAFCLFVKNRWIFGCHCAQLDVSRCLLSKAKLWKADVLWIFSLFEILFVGFGILKQQASNRVQGSFSGVCGIRKCGVEDCSFLWRFVVCLKTFEGFWALLGRVLRWSAGAQRQ